MNVLHISGIEKDIIWGKIKQFKTIAVIEYINRISMWPCYANDSDILLESNIMEVNLKTITDLLLSSDKKKYMKTLI